MEEFSTHTESQGFHTKLWRGESMCMIGMDVNAPEADLVGFAIEVQAPNSTDFVPLRNRLAFAYPPGTGVTGARQFDSTEAPFQKFRWIHFPKDPQAGIYHYRVTKMHMPTDGQLVKGLANTLPISLDPVTYDGKIDVGFTRNFASSQAYAERADNRGDILPATVDEGLQFVKPPGTSALYEWLGFEGRKLVFDFLEDGIDDPNVTLDAFVYDLNESAVVELLERWGSRLRVIIDDSKNHVEPHTSEQRAALRLVNSAGAANVKRAHFGNLQHNKVLIKKVDGKPAKVLTGSTNFSYRGLYIQANNAITFTIPAMAELFERAFEIGFDRPGDFSTDPLAAVWHKINVAGLPPIELCLSPHGNNADLSLSPVGDAIRNATTSVFFSIAFFNQIKSGAVFEATQALPGRDIFSYGAVNQVGKSVVTKPDGSMAVVDFSFLAKHSPEPFRSEWFAGKGINIHNKFVVTDFNTPAATVFTGSSNLSPSGEKNNGDHLIMIKDQRIAAAFAIEAVRLFDHLHFRTLMQDAGISHAISGSDNRIKLRKPRSISGGAAWFEASFVENSQRERDRKLFAH